MRLLYLPAAASIRRRLRYTTTSLEECKRALHFRSAKGEVTFSRRLPGERISSCGAGPSQDIQHPEHPQPACSWSSSQFRLQAANGLTDGGLALIVKNGFLAGILVVGQDLDPRSSVLQLLDELLDCFFFLSTATDVHHDIAVSLNSLQGLSHGLLGLPWRLSFVHGLKHCLQFFDFIFK